MTSTCASGSVVFGGDQGPWLGGRKIGSKWTWVTAEPWVYSDWAGGEPSGTYKGTIEDRLQMRGQDGTPTCTS